jgi:pimeloyl-ACP methyl ester carboxylesterase
VDAPVLRLAFTLVTGCAAALAAACGGGEEARSGSSETQAAPATTERVRIPNDATPTRVDVGGYHLAIRCSGRGRPVAVLEAGYGLSSARWRRTQTVVQRTHRVCSYDRAGIGRSDDRPPESERTTPDDLHALLQTVGVLAPYVLAGHSAGGAHAVEYANAYPDDVAGIVLVDSVGTGPLPDRSLPLVVLEAGRDRTGGWAAAQAATARLSQNSVHVVAPRSGHHIQASQPELVAAAIRAVARGGRLPPCRAFVRFGGACP